MNLCHCIFFFTQEQKAIKFACYCVLGIFLSFFSCSRSNEIERPLSFTSIETPIPARTSAISFVIENKAYILGGRASAQGNYLTDFWQYDPQANTWTQLPNIPFKGRVKATAQVIDGKAFVGLGFNGSVYVDSCYLRDWWCYDAASATWERKANYPTNQTNAAISFTANNKVYVCFGFFNGFVRNVYTYNVQNDGWTKCTDANTYMLAAGVGCSNNKRYFAGTGYKTKMINNWWEFFPETEQWESRKSMPDKGRMFASSLVIDDNFFVLGGRLLGGTETREIFYDDIMQYDADNDEWQLRGRIPKGGREHMITFTINGKGYVGFGSNKDGVILNDLYSFE